MIIYRVVGWIGTKPRTIKIRRLSKYERWSNQYRKYRRTWWWEEMRFNVRHSVLKSNY